MPADSRPRYANFPEREPKVQIGPNINATASKQLTRLSIGTYEMSVPQQERGQITTEAARVAMSAIAKAGGMQLTPEKSREFVGAFSAANADVKWNVWITTPFEPGQSAHIVWAKYTELTGEKKVGIAFRLNTAFTSDDVGNVLRTAQKNAQVIPDGEPYILKGNPPPRFQKKKVDAEPAADGAEAPAAPAAEAPQA
ncbi:MAG: hypothetical protein J0M02_08400 [Planctomycetes bacterium]|nr:hypothetical protein [Planctomycetota bacterium]